MLHCAGRPGGAASADLQPSQLASPALPAAQQLGSLPAYNFVRKAASDYGWDWGPAFAPAGIPGAVELLGYSTAVLTGASRRRQAACCNTS